MSSEYFSALAGALTGLLALGAGVMAVSALVVGVLAVRVALKHESVPVIYNLRSLVGRRTTTLVTAAGLALVVAVFTTVLMFGAGIQHTLVSTGDPFSAKVLRKGALSEVESDVSRDQLKVLMNFPEVASGNDGKPLASYELVVLIFAPREPARDENDGANLTVRGVGHAAFELHPFAELEGRLFKPGTNEIVIGKALAGRFKGAALGGTMRFGRRSWRVVGIAGHDGNSYDSEVWGDAEQMETAFNRRPVTVSLKLKDPAGIEQLRSRIENDVRVSSLEVMPEPAYWRARSERFGRFVTILGLTVALIFCAGAALAAMITMHAQVTACTRDIGTLRAIGYRKRAILVSFVAESVLLAVVSGMAGIALAALTQRLSFSTTNWQTYSEVSFQFHLTPLIVLVSLVLSLALGYAGGVLPALRAARMPILQAFRGG
jgi:ABC-type lipoprotein release transport system permease subunit